MLPELVFITAVQQKYTAIWARTFGTDMAFVADVVAARLPKFRNIVIATRRQKRGVGDIDLAIYDVERQHLLLCEIKTVFDKFRTEFQAGNFINQKVNFERAIQQLSAANVAIESGVWTMKEIFEGGTGSPSKIFRLLLLWRDHINPSLDGGECIPVVDFASFIYMYERCAGDLEKLIRSLTQLEKLFWVSKYEDYTLPVGGAFVEVLREGEIGCLPPADHLRGLPLTDVVLEEALSLLHLPDDWEHQRDAAGDKSIYLFRTPIE
jgi:hypothetical protein